jgi:2,3-bisphosphoglycerate-dependent phosphoglycerate mutase
MTKVYFVRHAQSDISVRDERLRPLTEKGRADCALITKFLRDKEIDAILSSPFVRTIDTIADFAKSAGLEIEVAEDFRERKNIWRETPEDFKAFAQRQWMDFSYKTAGDECLADVQTRNIAALNKALKRHSGKNIVIGTHGTALSTIINYYDSTYGFEDFMVMVNIMPWIVVMEFEDIACLSISKVNLFDLKEKSLK